MMVQLIIMIHLTSSLEIGYARIHHLNLMEVAMWVKVFCIGVDNLSYI